MMDIIINKLHREKDASETSSTAQSRAPPHSDRPKYWTICPFCSVRYQSYRSLIDKPTRCESCYLKFFASESHVKGTKTTLSTMEKSVSSQNHLVASAETKKQVQPQKPQPRTAPFNCGQRFCAICPFCELRYRFPVKYVNKRIICKCKKKFKAVEVNISSLQQKTVPSKSPVLSCAVNVGQKRKRNEFGETYNAQNRCVVHNNTRVFNGNGDAREASKSGKLVHVVDRSTKDPFSNAINPNQKMERNQDAQVGAVVGNSGDLEVDKNSEDVIDKAVDNSIKGFNDIGDAGRQEESGRGKQLHVSTRSEETLPNVTLSSRNVEMDKTSEDVIDRVVDDNRRGFNDNGEARRLDASGWGKQLREVDRSEETLPNVINTNQMLNQKQDAMGSFGNLEVEKNSGFCNSGSGGAAQPKVSECASLKFNDFNKVREDANFSDCQAWALYDKADGMPRQYAVIRKVSAPSFGLRITYLEPDPDDEKDIQWFEEDLPVSAGKFRLGKNENTKDRSIFSHAICCQGSVVTGHFTVSPRKGETWALFKNWDINWSSEPDSHRKYEYEIVEILSNISDGAGVSVAILHKAKGFASVFFRMGTEDTDITQIQPHSLYRFSHNIPSFKMKRVNIKGVPKDAYELDQAALPKAIEEKVVPAHLYAEPKPEALCFPNKGKVFQTGQIWSFYCGNDTLPLYYCRIQKITLIQAFEQEAVFKLHVGRLKAKPFPEEVTQWEDKKMPVGCGIFSVRKINDVLTTDDVSHQVVPQTSMDGSEYTILPKIGEVWAIYRFWNCHKEFKEVGCCDYDIVEVLDDTLDYKVLALEPVLFSSEDEEKNTLFTAAESRHPYCDDADGMDVMFTIPRSKILRFSHQIPASRITKEMQGDMKKLFEVDYRALPANVRLQDHRA